MSYNVLTSQNFVYGFKICLRSPSISIEYWNLRSKYYDRENLISTSDIQFMSFIKFIQTTALDMR